MARVKFLLALEKKFKLAVSWREGPASYPCCHVTDDGAEAP